MVEFFDRSPEFIVTNPDEAKEQQRRKQQQLAVEVAMREVGGSLDNLASLCHELSKAKGFWEEGHRNLGEMMMLVVTEASEAFEEYRSGHGINTIRMSGPTGKPEGFPTEIADLLIRVFDLCGFYNIDIADVIKKKLLYNITRPHKHGKKC